MKAERWEKCKGKKEYRCIDVHKQCIYKRNIGTDSQTDRPL